MLEEYLGGNGDMVLGFLVVVVLILLGVVGISTFFVADTQNQRLKIGGGLGLSVGWPAAQSAEGYDSGYGILQEMPSRGITAVMPSDAYYPNAN